MSEPNSESQPRRPMTGKSELIRDDVAAGALGALQLTLVWFILGNEETLLRTTPVTVSAVVTADLMTWIGVVPPGADGTRAARIMHLVIVCCVIGFCFVAAVATSRGADPIGNPPWFTEWAVTIAIVFVSAFAGERMRRST